MAYQFEVAHRTPSRTRLHWSGETAPSEPILKTIARDPSVRSVDFRPATGSVVVVHGCDFGIDRLSTLVGPLDVAVREEPLSGVVAKRSGRVSNGSRPSKREKPGDPGSVSADSGLRAGGKWSPIVAEVEAVVLFGLILGWIRDWFTGRSLALSTVILLLVTAGALALFWLRRRRKAEVVEPELEFIYA